MQSNCIDNLAIPIEDLETWGLLEVAAQISNFLNWIPASKKRSEFCKVSFQPVQGFLALSTAALVVPVQLMASLSLRQKCEGHCDARTNTAKCGIVPKMRDKATNKRQWQYTYPLA